MLASGSSECTDAAACVLYRLQTFLASSIAGLPQPAGSLSPPQAAEQKALQLDVHEQGTGQRLLAGHPVKAECSVVAHGIAAAKEQGVVLEQAALNGVVGHGMWLPEIEVLLSLCILPRTDPNLAHLILPDGFPSSRLCCNTHMHGGTCGTSWLWRTLVSITKVRHSACRKRCCGCTPAHAPLCKRMCACMAATLQASCRASQ